MVFLLRYYTISFPDAKPSLHGSLLACLILFHALLILFHLFLILPHLFLILPHLCSFIRSRIRPTFCSLTVRLPNLVVYLLFRQAHPGEYALLGPLGAVGFAERPALVHIVESLLPFRERDGGGVFVAEIKDVRALLDVGDRVGEEHLVLRHQFRERVVLAEIHHVGVEGETKQDRLFFLLLHNAIGSLAVVRNEGRCRYACAAFFLLWGEGWIHTKQIHMCISGLLRNLNMKVPSCGIDSGYFLYFCSSTCCCVIRGPGKFRGGARSTIRDGWDGGLNLVGFSSDLGLRVGPVGAVAIVLYDE